MRSNKSHKLTSIHRVAIFSVGINVIATTGQSLGLQQVYSICTRSLNKYGSVFCTTKQTSMICVFVSFLF